MVEHFLAENVRPTFRLTSLEAPDADARARAARLSSIEPTQVLTTRIPEDCSVDPAIVLEPKVSTRWVRETAASYGGEKADDAVLVEIVSRIRQKAVFATLDLDDRHVAWGLGGRRARLCGALRHRRRPGTARHRARAAGGDEPDGLGPREGAHSAYLQVRDDNEVARGALRGARLRAGLPLHPPGHADARFGAEGRDERAGDDERAGERQGQASARHSRRATRISVDSTGAA